MHITERGGSWYYTIDVGTNPVTGKRRQQKKGGFKSKKEAERAGRKALQEYENGLLEDVNRLTFGELCDLFLREYQQRHNVKHSTFVLKQEQIKVWLKHFDQIQVRQLTRNLIQTALDSQSEHYAPSTMNTLFNTLRMLMHRAREIGCIISDPSEFAYIPKKRKSLEEMEKSDTESKYLDKQTLKLFLDTAKDCGHDHDYALFLLLAYTGMRIGEATALKWSDIDVEAQSISIVRGLSNRRKKTNDYILDTPKTKTSKRTIHVDQKVLSELLKIKTKQKELRLKNKHTHDNGFVFINWNKYPGYPVILAQVLTRIKRILDIAEIKQKVTTHTFRHTHTSLLAEAGVDLVSIMERLGHKDDKTTREIYLHVTAEMKKEAAQKFSKLMDGF